MKVLNAYAGLGGNRHLWPASWSVFAVESNPEIAAEYRKRYPHDIVLVGDAHAHIRDHFWEYDLIWTSPPCPTHSVMQIATRHTKKSYPDMKLYEEIIFLQTFFKGKFVVENVKPYYTPLIEPTCSIGRHVFWTNLNPGQVKDLPFHPEHQKNIIKSASNAEGRKALAAWLGIPLPEKNIYVPGSNDPGKVLRNCVHPAIGLFMVREMVK